MKRQVKVRIGILVSLLLIAGTATGLVPTQTFATPQSYTVIDYFPSPDESPTGLAWDGQYLWCADAGTLEKIYKIDPSTGLPTHSIPSPWTSPWGLAWDGQHLWCSDAAADTIYQLNPSTGSVISSFPSPENRPTGLAWDGQHLWCSDADTSTLYKLDPLTGSVIISFGSPEPCPRGLAWDGQYLWNADICTDTIYKIYVGSISISATINMDPDTLNLESKGEWITCYIELPEDCDVADIDVSTVLLNDTVLAETKPTNLGDYDSDGIPDLMVKFDRASVQNTVEPGDEVEITVEGELTDGTPFKGSDTIRVIDKGNEKAEGQIIEVQFTLSQNYPNPFNPETTVEYSTAENCNVLLKIYNLSGMLIKTLVDEYQTAGSYSIIWYGDTDAGQEVASGVYFYQIKAGDFVSTKKMVVLK